MILNATKDLSPNLKLLPEYTDLCLTYMLFCNQYYVNNLAHRDFFKRLQPFYTISADYLQCEV